MSTPAIKTRVSIEGEKEYKAALAEINSGLRVLNSEMKLTSTQFAENADGMDALTAKGDILERQILSQKEKIETLKAALQNSAEAFGESDKKTSAWKVSLNNAEAELVKMERELRTNREAVQQAAQAAQSAENAFDDMSDALGENSDAAKEGGPLIDKLRDAFGGGAEGANNFGSIVDDLAGKLGINLPGGASKALESLGGLSGGTAAAAGAFAALIAAVVEIEKALIGLTTDRAAAATELANIAETINMDVTATQQWDYVLKTVGSSIGEAQGDLSAFQERIMDAATGTGEASEMFAKLGVNVVDQTGALRDTESVLLDTVHALQLMADETERNATSSTLLGGTGEKLIPIYNQSAESLDYLLEKKKELGIMTGDEIEALKDVSEALLDYEERTTSAKDTIAAEFAPAMAAFQEEMGIALQDLGEAAEESGLVNFFGAILELITALLPLIQHLGTGLEALEPVFDTLSIALGVVADVLALVVNGVAAFQDLVMDIPRLLFGWGGESNYDKYLDNIAGIFSGNDSATKRALTNAYNSSGHYNFAGGYTWVGENGPELAYLPQGTRIFNNQESRELGGDVFYVTIDAKNVREFNDIVAMAQAKRRTERMEVAK